MWQWIRTVEANGDPTAVSSKGARGLSQIMPEALHDYNVNHPNNQYSWDDMFDATKNLQVGKWYLTKQIPLMLKNRGLAVTTDNVLWAYNAGINRVAKGEMPPRQGIISRLQEGTLLTGRLTNLCPQISLVSVQGARSRRRCLCWLTAARSWSAKDASRSAASNRRRTFRAQDFDMLVQLNVNTVKTDRPVSEQCWMPCSSAYQGHRRLQPDRHRRHQPRDIGLLSCLCPQICQPPGCARLVARQRIQSPSGTFCDGSQRHLA
jgi:hypothetical protein